MSKNKLRQGVRRAVLIAGVILLGINLFTLDYDQLSSEPFSKENVGGGIRILSNLFIIAAMVLSLRYTSDKE